MAKIDRQRGVVRQYLSGHSSRVIRSGPPPKHGQYGTPTYSSWLHMIQRCTNPRTRAYPRYGGRGITVCDKWREFAGFYEDMGDRPDGMTLDRIDSNGNYEPGNVRWATPAEQQRNKRNTKLNDAAVAWARSGSGGSQAQMAAVLGVHRSTISNVVNGKRWS